MCLSVSGDPFISTFTVTSACAPTSTPNTVEGFLSLLRRGINGVYHHVSEGHLERYCDEFGFRYENRKVSDGERAKMLVVATEGKRLTFKQPASLS